MRMGRHYSFVDPGLGARPLAPGRTIERRVAKIEERLAFADANAPRLPTCRLVIHIVAAATGVSRERILSSQRGEEVIRARHAAIWLSREVTRQSLPQIGKAFGRDHSTILEACRSAERRRDREPLFRVATDSLLNLFMEPV